MSLNDHESSGALVRPPPPPGGSSCADALTAQSKKPAATNAQTGIEASFRQKLILSLILFISSIGYNFHSKLVVRVAERKFPLKEKAAERYRPTRLRLADLVPRLVVEPYSYPRSRNCGTTITAEVLLSSGAFAATSCAFPARHAARNTFKWLSPYWLRAYVKSSKAADDGLRPALFCVAVIPTTREPGSTGWRHTLLCSLLQQPMSRAFAEKCPP